LRGDQDVDLIEKLLQVFLEFPEKPFSPSVGAGDDLFLNGIFFRLSNLMWSGVTP
jgi:hypothetical protein